MPSPPSVPYISRTRVGSVEKSTSSGTLICIRNASSYCAMRVSISGSLTMDRWILFSSLIAWITSPWPSRSTPGGLRT